MEWLPRAHRVLALWELVVRWGLCRDPRAEHVDIKRNQHWWAHTQPRLGALGEALWGGCVSRVFGLSGSFAGQLLAVLHFP